MTEQAVRPHRIRASERPVMASYTREGVYLMMLDTSGYSTIVRHNPRDQAARIFDLLRERVLARVNTVSAEFRCAHADLWWWRGDGGILAIHDDEESVARDVALTAANDIIRFDLAQIRLELERMGLRGDLRLRLAVHKATIRLSSNGQSGLTHSPEINFAKHLEEATPADCIAISEDVHQSAGQHADLFAFAGTYEGRNIYLKAPTGDAADARHAWLSAAGFAGSQPVFTHPERPSQAEKARLIGVAKYDILDSGAALRTSAHYLVSPERPAHYRDAVLDFLRRGGTYRCVLLDPTCEAAATLSSYRAEDLSVKIRSSIKEFAHFKERFAPLTANLRVYQTRAFPGFTAIAADIESPTPLILICHYLMVMKSLSIRIEQADAPHYLVTSGSGAVLERLARLLRSATATLDRVL